jgi:outer membrane protein TolC
MRFAPLLPGTARRLLINITVLSSCILFNSASQAELSLQQAQQLALQNDPWLVGNKLQEQAIIANSVASSTFADPMVSLGFANLPTDGFRFNQEPMTQFKIGVSQQFPRGDSLALQKEQLVQMAAQYPQLRYERQAKLKVMVSKLWFDAFTTEQRIQLVEHSRPLFSQLVDIVEASYSTVQGSTTQQDVVRAQVELARLDDRLAALLAERDTSLAELSQWLQDELEPNLVPTANSGRTLPQSWPIQAMLDSSVINLLQQQDLRSLSQILAQHPALMAIEQQIKSSQSAVNLAEQKYQPQWGVNASYAYRDNDPLGNTRADFFSIGVTVDVPFFTANKQDKEVEASRLQAESIKTDKQLLLRQLLAQMLSTWRTLDSLNQRIEHYLQKILPQMAEQSEAALNAYTSDEGDFSEVMRARIAQLNTELDVIKLQNEQAKSRIQLDYFFTTKNNQAPLNAMGEQP